MTTVKETTTTGTEVAVFNMSNYAALVPQAAEEFREAMEANIDGDETSPRQILTTIKPPGGGGTMWAVPSFDSNDFETKTLTGIILEIGSEKVLFEGKYGEGQSIVSCSSNNGVFGNGSPGGECAVCPNNEYGTALTGKGKACSDYKPIYVLLKDLEDQAMPCIIRVSPGSFEALKNYRIKLTRAKLKMYTIETVFSLKKEKSASGSDFASIVFAPGERVLDKSTQESIKGYRDELMPFIKPVSPGRPQAQLNAA